LGVVPNFFKLKKYNLLAFVEQNEFGSNSGLNKSNLDDAAQEAGESSIVDNKHNSE